MLDKQYQDSIDTLLEKIQDAEAIVIRGAAGMSVADGYSYYDVNETFTKYFGKFADKYGITSIFGGFYHPFKTREERWAYLATMGKLIHDTEPGQPYFDLYKLLQGKDYFIVTTNQDTLFNKVFPDERVAPIQGNSSYYQCSRPCHDEVYKNKEMIEEMYANIEGTTIPTSLIPVCPKCGEDMEPWVRSFVFLEGNHWKNIMQKYLTYLRENKHKKILFLELGVGTMTPMFIKEPFWEMTQNLPGAYYISIIPKDAVIPQEIVHKGITIKEDIAHVLRDALKEKDKVR